MRWASSWALLTDPFMRPRRRLSGSAPARPAMPTRRSAYAAERKPTDALCDVHQGAAADAVRAALERVGGGLRRLADRPTAMRRSARTTPPAASPAPRSAPTICSRRTRLPALRWPAAAPTFSVANGGSGRSDLFQAGAYRPPHRRAGLYLGALAYGWQDITTNRTVTVAGVDQLRAEFNANACLGPARRRLSLRLAVDRRHRHHALRRGQFTTFDLPAYAEQAIVGTNTFALAYGAQETSPMRAANSASAPTNPLRCRTAS